MAGLNCLNSSANDQPTIPAVNKPPTPKTIPSHQGLGIPEWMAALEVRNRWSSTSGPIIQGQDTTEDSFSRFDLSVSGASDLEAIDRLMSSASRSAATNDSSDHNAGNPGASDSRC